MIDINKLTIKGQEALQRAQRLAGEHGNQQMEPEHLLASMLEDREGLVSSILKKLGIPVEEVRNQIQEGVERLPKVSGEGVGQVYLSKELNDVLEKGLKESHNLKDEYISVEHILLAVSESKSECGECPAGERDQPRQHPEGASGCSGRASGDGSESGGQVPGSEAVRAGLERAGTEGQAGPGHRQGR